MPREPEIARGFRRLAAEMGTDGATSRSRSILEWHRWRELLGGPEQVRRFVERACPAK
jgi:hypothetical protein